MEYTAIGKIIKMTGGLIQCACIVPGRPRQVLAGQTVECRARGGFRHAGLRPLVGDNAEVSYRTAPWEQTPDGIRPSADRTGLVLSDILPRRNSLIRPPLANLDMTLVVTAAAPAPDLPTLDKLFCIPGAQPDCACFRGRQRELDPGRAEELTDLYRRAGIRRSRCPASAARGWMRCRRMPAPPSPAGRLPCPARRSRKIHPAEHAFPGLSLVTGGIDLRIARGKNTTRHTELFPLPDFGAGTHIADTAGFSLLDFEHFDFFGLDDRRTVFRNLPPISGNAATRAARI